MGDTELCYILNHLDFNMNRIIDGKIRTDPSMFGISMHVPIVMRNGNGLTPRHYVIDTIYALNASSNVIKKDTLTLKISGLMKRVRKELGTDIESATIRIVVEDRLGTFNKWYFSEFVHINRRTFHPLSFLR